MYNLTQTLDQIWRYLREYSNYLDEEPRLKVLLSRRKKSFPVSLVSWYEADSSSERSSHFQLYKNIEIHFI